jgi:hypothetical protein
MRSKLNEIVRQYISCITDQKLTCNCRRLTNLFMRSNNGRQILQDDRKHYCQNKPLGLEKKS